MLNNYFKTALRALRRWKGHASINVFGLAVAVACCLLIGLHMADELSYDRFHEEAESIMQVLSERDGSELPPVGRTPRKGVHSLTPNKRGGRDD